MKKERQVTEPYIQRIAIRAALSVLAPALVPAGGFAGDQLMLEPMWQRVADLNGEKGAVESAVFSPDGSLIASGNKYDNRIIVWRTTDGSVLWQHRAEQEVEAVSFSPDGSLLVAGGEDDVVRIFRVADGAEGRVDGDEGRVDGDEGRQDGDEGRQDGDEGRQDGDESRGEGELIGTLQHRHPIDGLRFSHDGTMLATGEEEGMLRLWRMPQGEPLAAVDNDHSTINSIDFTSDDRYIATAADNGQVRIWSVPDLEVVRILERVPNDEHGRVSVRISEDDELVAASGYGGFVMVWRFADGELLKTLNYTGRKVEAIALSPDGRYLLSAGFEPRIFVTRLEDYSLAHVSSHSGPTEYIDFSSNGAMVVTAHEDGTIRLWLWVSEDPSINHKEHQALRRRQAAAAATREPGDPP